MTAVMLVRSAEGARVAGAIASICPSSRRLRPAHEPMRTLYYSFSLNDAVPRNHLVRRLAAAVDFSFVYGLVRLVLPRQAVRSRWSLGAGWRADGRARLGNAPARAVVLPVRVQSLSEALRRDPRRNISLGTAPRVATDRSQPRARS